MRSNLSRTWRHAFAGSEDGTVNIPIAEGTPEGAAAPTVALNNMDGFSTTAPLTTPVTGTLDESSLVVGESIVVLELTTDEIRWFENLDMIGALDGSR